MSSNNNNQTPVSVITIATWALVVVLVGITGTLCAIVIRDGNNALVSQAMGELLWMGGIAIATLVGLLGFTKYLEGTASSPSSSSASSAPAGNTSSSPLGIAAGDLGSILAGIAAAQNAAPAPVATVPVAAPAPAPAAQA